MNSATTAPISARPAASRSPARKYGVEAGSTTSIKARSRPERKERATSTYSSGTERAPSETLTMMENTEEKTIVASRAAPV